MKKDIWTRVEYSNSVIAQADSGGYDPSGWVCCYYKKHYYLARFGHCSCYGTFEALCGGGISDYFESGTPQFDWSGTKAELLKMAKNQLCPVIPERKINENDYDSGYLLRVYEQVIEHFKKEK